MRLFFAGIAGLGLLGLGFILGASGAFAPAPLLAQAEDDAPAKAKNAGKANAEAKAEGPQLSDETEGKIKAAAAALNAAMEALKQEQLYNPATKGLNTFAILSGRVETLKDLESGRGVDPETFAALYCDLATDEVAEKLGRDQENRLTYAGKVIKMYPVSRLRSLYASRAVFTGEELSKPDPKADKSKAKKKPAADEEKDE